MVMIRELMKDSITLNLWTDNVKRNGYITLNLSCINDDFKLLNINLKTELMPIKHSAKIVVQADLNQIEVKINSKCSSVVQYTLESHVRNRLHNEMFIYRVV
ncbi:hypothetical protein Bhyg_02372 [Pseudolycoriella hygida]|uniref:Uncharacterized protein n=1 Tax=Pseudolycoriella hygida TaxID=35572 RepID=A0A9Q0S6F9_9DIPT|nr:hypothetical protein Bhyg_02372 [Pseudolycoriella hygida]